MIYKAGNSFVLNTLNTSYLIGILDTGHLEHLYYGKKIHDDTQALKEKLNFAPGYTINYSQENKETALESINLEVSTLGKGDVRKPFIELEYSDGNRTCDFVYHSDYINQEKNELNTLPSSYGECDHLCIELKEKETEVYLYLHYYVFEKEDVIVKQATLVNKSDDTLTLKRMMSNQIDFNPDDYTLTTFTGAWAREMKRNDIKVFTGTIENGSITGYSSNHANPFVMLSKNNCDEEHGECYGFNLVYSGNHIETVEKGAFGKVRFLQGIHPIGFSFKLQKEECFEAPEAIMSYGDKGYNDLSHHFHDFINNHIVRGTWQNKRRPVLLNSWEAAYFKINEAKLVNLAKVAKDEGIELFVMDDGWFGERNDDTSSLGDWDVNKKKFPGGLEGLSKKIHDLDLMFGIWVEPEMVSVNSNLYKEHQNWTLENPNRNHSEGRNQRTLDLSNPEVQTFLIEKMSEVFTKASVDYVKWDMNRMISDAYSVYLPSDRQGEVYHRQIIGFYNVIKELTTRFPNVLFEGCSSGGNRFDLGMLCYFPQIWASDDTDALVRCEMQNNYSYGYPLSTIGAHVSSVPNHQTLRKTELSTRFNVACFGNLGYECNLVDQSNDDLNEIKKEISFYKENGEIFAYGTFNRIRRFKDGYAGSLEASTSNITEWSVVSKDKTKGFSFIFQKHVIPNTAFEKVTPIGFDDDIKYHFYNEEVKHDIAKFGDLINTAAPFHVKQGGVLHHAIGKFVKMDGEKEDYLVHGDTLRNAGVVLKQGFAAVGYNNEVRYFQDFGTRLYTIEKVED